MRFINAPILVNSDSALQLELKEKFTALYTDRHIKHFQIQLHIPFFKRWRIKKNLEKIQKLFYRLGYYFEVNKNLSNQQLLELWRTVTKNLLNTGWDEKTINLIIQRMKEYMTVELEIINGNKDISLIEIESHYEHKIGDVLLQREIIILSAKTSISSELFAVWKLYDILCEIESDLRDIDNFGVKINRNRLMWLLKRNDLDNSIIQYRNYLTLLKKNTDSFLGSSIHHSDSTDIEVVSRMIKNKINYCNQKFQTWLINGTTLMSETLAK